MTVLLYIAGVLAIVVGLAVSIGLHEFGHMIPAKKFGIRVPQWFVGFGTTLWSTKRNGTEYGIKAFPLGGFVKIIGMLPPHPDKPSGKPQSGFSRLISDAREAEAALLQPGDENRMFYQLPWWKKVIVMAGGPTVNLVIAFFLFGGLFYFHGVSEATTTVATRADCVIAVPKGEQAARDTCLPTDPEAPSKTADIRPGDKIVAFDDTRITSYTQLQKLIRSHPDASVTITVLRDGETLKKSVTTQVNTLPSMDDDLKSVKVGYLGISPRTENVSKGPLYTVEQMGDMTVETVKSLGHMPARIWDVGRAVLGLQDRDPEGPMSVVGIGRVAGEVSADDSIAGGNKVAFIITLLAGVNLFVGMFNFVPLLPLDGGHIAGALYEALRRGWAKLFGRPDPGHFDVAKLLPVAYVTAGVLLVMTVLLVYADLAVPIT
ncbi:membrane-associated protease RseP (regulator of RpoE activity) [Marmoricola sp. OAE513]|uniref:M50 family metallopeptidase n=1 Tax=Marmoricola sp. OAE513 TaxID=2817894 RepID=UPI001AE92E74